MLMDTLVRGGRDSRWLFAKYEVQLGALLLVQRYHFEHLLFRILSLLSHFEISRGV
jgi:hypothetical protein